MPSNSSGDEISEAASDSHTVHHSISDALAADVEALELISFCHADFDSETPSIVHPDYDPIRKLQECAIPSNYPFCEGVMRFLNQKYIFLTNTERLWKFL